MKKALTITIAGTLFTIEEDAYELLDRYLKSIQTYFGTNPDRAEIIKDIEARIAEQLIERQTPTGIVTSDAVSELMSVMGKVEEFDGSVADTAEMPYEAKRRFFRNPDDVVISGVCSGIAAYFGLQALWVRIGFAILSLLSLGTALILYIALVLIIPMASTPAEKLQMAGGPVTLESFSKQVKDEINTVRTRSTGLTVFLERAFEVFGRIVRFCFRLAKLVIGFGLIVGSIFATVASVFFAVNLLFNAQSPFIDFPVAAVMAMPVYNAFVMLGFVLVVIPSIFIGTAGLRLVRSRKFISIEWALGLAAVWIVSLIIFGSMLVRHVPLIKSRLQTMPEYQVVTRTLDVPAFSKIDISGNATVRLVQGDSTSVTQNGAPARIDRMNAVVEDDTLVLSEHPYSRSCIFCFMPSTAEIVITVPDLDAIEVSDAVDITGEDLTFADISIDLSDAAYANLELSADRVRITGQDASRISLKGITNALSVEMSGVSRLFASGFTANTVTATTTDNASIEVHVLKTLNATASDASDVAYKGTPEVIGSENDAGSIQGPLLPANPNRDAR